MFVHIKRHPFISYKINLVLLVIYMGFIGGFYQVIDTAIYNYNNPVQVVQGR
jgi:hypothetical protein